MSIAVAPEVAAALARGGAVVALESTIICHGQLASTLPFRFPFCPPLARMAQSKVPFLRFHSGMPYPKNLQTAVEVEAVVRDTGAIPATIAILDGVPHVGQFSLFCFFSYCSSWPGYLVNIVASVNPRLPNNTHMLLGTTISDPMGL